MTLTHSLNRNHVIVPVALANTDGTPRATNKSQLIPILEQEDVTQPNMPTSLTPTCSIIDAMALVQALGKPKGAKTFGDYYEKFAAAVKTNFQGPCTRVDVVFDCYEEHAMKNVTRERRSGKGRGIRCKISKSDLKLPEQWKSFIDANDNKIALAKFLKEACCSGGQGIGCQWWKQRNDCLLHWQEHGPALFFTRGGGHSHDSACTGGQIKRI